MNEETNGRLPFLDVMTLGSGTSFVTTIIQNLTLQVKGFLRNGGKKASICSLVIRAKRICSPTLLPEDLDKTRDIFNSFVCSQMVIRSVSIIDKGRTQRKQSLGSKFS